MVLFNMPLFSFSLWLISTGRKTMRNETLWDRKIKSSLTESLLICLCIWFVFLRHVQEYSAKLSSVASSYLVWKPLYEPQSVWLLAVLFLEMASKPVPVLRSAIMASSMFWSESLPVVNWLTSIGFYFHEHKFSYVQTTNWELQATIYHLYIGLHITRFANCIKIDCR